jgi:hypothetical protein
MWLYLVGTPSGAQVIAATYNGGAGQTLYQAGAFILGRTSSNTILFQDAYGAGPTSGVLNNNQWYHVAAVYKHSTTQWSLFIDGVRSQTVTSTAVTREAPQFHIGGSLNDSNLANAWLNGNIDELRVTVGSDRGYTGATITVPTAAFPTT